MELSSEAHLRAADPAAIGRLSARRSLPEAWGAVWASHPERPVLGERPPGASDGGALKWVSAGQLEEASAAAAQRLASVGVGPGDRLLCCASTSIGLVALQVGALRSGVVVVPADPALSPRELAHLVADTRPAAFVSSAPVLGDLVGQLAPQVVVLDSQPAARSPRAAPAPILDRVDPDAPAVICHTSGTTGVPKGAVLSHANLVAGLEALVVAWGWSPEDRLVHALPTFHAHGLFLGVYGTLLAGASAVLLGRFDPEAVLDAVEEGGATMFFGVPTMYHRLLAATRVASLGRLRLAVSGSAPMAAELHRRVERAAGVSVLERYGMTETLMISSNPLHGERRPGTVGTPLPGMEVQLEGSGSGSPEGEILVRGPSVTGGYWERPEADAEAFAGGWFRTGDLGEVDEAGHLRICGRVKDLVISGGHNVHPREVEDALASHPAVAEVAVAGTASDEWGEVVTAWVVPNAATPRARLEELLDEHARGLLAPWKRPRRYRIVGELPRNAMGKLLRSELP